MVSNRKSQLRKKKKWNEQQTLRFVQLYEAEEVLWNVKLNNYKNRDARNAALERIIKNMDLDGLTIQDINTKINNIRSTFSQEKLKIKKSLKTGSGADDVYMPSVPWFEIADRFLSEVIKSRPTFQNLVNSSHNLSASPSPHVPPPSPSTDIQASGPSLNSPISPSPVLQDQRSSNGDQLTVPRHSKRKQIKIKVPQYIDESIETLQTIKNEVLNTREKEDEYYYFAKNIASQLRLLPIADALNLQVEILVLLRNKRLALPHNFSSQPEYYEGIPEYTDLEQSTPIPVFETNLVSEDELSGNDILAQAIQNTITS